MTSFLLLYSLNGVKQWTIIEAESASKAMLELRTQEPMVLDQIVHIEKVTNGDLLAL
jgi:hypothetical protein